MTKYEIMLVVDGTLSQEQTKKAIQNLTDLLANTTNYTEKFSWSEKLAYSIKKIDIGHRLLFNFETDDHKIIEEFNRKVLINKHILRHLVINLQKEYGYKTTINPKKVKSAEIRQEKYLKYLELRKKQQEQLELSAAKDATVKEAGLREITDYSKMDRKNEPEKDDTETVNTES